MTTSLTLGEETLELLEWPRLCAHLASFASTVPGRRASQRLELPSGTEISHQLLAETLEMRNLDGTLEGGLSFQGVHDLGPTLLCCNKGGTASGEELLALADTLAAARRLRRQIADMKLRPVVTNLIENLATLPGLEKRLKYSLEAGGRVADRASSRLANWRQRQQELRQQRSNKLQDLIRHSTSLLQDTIVAERYGRPVLAVKASASMPGLVHDSSASGNTIYVEPHAVIDLGNQIARLEGSIREEEQHVLAELSASIAAQLPELENLASVLLQLDLALTRSRYSTWLGGVTPTIDSCPEAPFQLHDLRHPLLVWQHQYEQGPPVVPITVKVSSDLRVVAITGPNTGGKTVALKSIGMAVLMARAGLQIPCSSSPVLPWCAQVLADIGDDQSLQQSLSTFGGHIQRVSRILEAVENGPAPSLVLLDEVGAGTDPAEGTALATALLRYLADRARLTVATTHFNGLKVLKYSDPRFENSSVAFNNITLSPTYELLWGVPGCSNALDIAGRLGLNCAVVSEARSLLQPTSEGAKKIETIIKGLEQQRQQQQAAVKNASSLLARTELLHEELLGHWRKQRRQSAELQEQIRQHLEASIQDAQKEVRHLIRRLRDHHADGETARTIGLRLRHLEKLHRPQQPTEKLNSWRPEVGERVRLLALDKAAEVLTVSEDGLQLTVRCGPMRSTVELSGVQSLDGQHPAPAPPVAGAQARFCSQSSPHMRTSDNTIDVRGLRVYEAEAAVEEYLRRVSGPVWVVHGIGTGKLKLGLRTWLQSVPYVKRVCDAEQADGGPGCSVIWMH